MLVVFFVTLIDLRIYVRIYKYFSSFSSLLLYLLFVWRIFSAVVFVPLDVCVNAMFHLFSVAAFIIWLSFYLKRCSDSECLTYICRYSNHSVLVCPVQRIRLCAWCHSYRTQNTTLFHINNTHIYRVSCRVIVTVITGTRCFFRCVCAFRRIFCMTDVFIYVHIIICVFVRYYTWICVLLWMRECERIYTIGCCECTKISPHTYTYTAIEPQKWPFSFSFAQYDLQWSAIQTR